MWVRELRVVYANLGELSVVLSNRRRLCTQAYDWEDKHVYIILPPNWFWVSSAYLNIDHHKVFAEFSNFLGFGKYGF